MKNFMQNFERNAARQANGNFPNTGKFPRKFFTKKFRDESKKPKLGFCENRPKKTAI